MLFEYRIPGLSGLVASFDYQFSGPRRRTTPIRSRRRLQPLRRRRALHLDIGGTTVTWRLAVDNVTDRHYWSTIAPSNLTGANTGNLLAHLGSPRTVLASVTVNF